MCILGGQPLCVKLEQDNWVPAIRYRTIRSRTTGFRNYPASSQ